jgi:PKD repeat protein
VTLTVTDDGNATDSVEQLVVTDQQAPIASFTFNCTSLSCTFDGSGSSDPDGTVDGFAWDFGDGATGTGATPAHTFAFSGGHTVTLTVTDNAGATDSTSSSLAVAVTLPITLQAEDYKVGGAGIGFADTTAGNLGGAYRTDAVDIQATTDTGGGYNVGWTAAGEWLAWDVNVPSTAVYTFTARVAAPAAGSRFHLEVDGVNVTGAVTVPKTNNYQTWKNVTTGNVTLTGGTHTLTFVEETSGFNLNYVVATAH